MLHSSFKNKFPFVYEYFESLLGFVFDGKRDFPQSIIFEGADTKTQYLFALELAGHQPRQTGFASGGAVRVQKAL